MERNTFFVKVLLPLALPEVYTYRVPFELNDTVEIGKRVAVQFGKTRIYSGLIVQITQQIPTAYEVKYILEILDDIAVVTPAQLQFWNWIANYYLCTSGEVMNAALPSGLKLSSETKIQLNPYRNFDENALNDREFLIFQALELQETLTLSEVAKIIETKKVLPLVKTMIDKGVITTIEELEDKFSPKTETFVELTSDFRSEKAISGLLSELEKKSEKQFNLIMAFLKISNYFQEAELNDVSKIALLKLADVSDSVLQSLIKKSVFNLSKKNISRLKEYSKLAESESIILSSEQQKALDDIKDQFENFQTILFQGVTGSGKTEIYIKLIQEQLQQGNQVLYLVPEIALTTQTINRLRKYFGSKAGVYHSRYNEKERVEIWNKTLKSDFENPKYQIILGARSALFLPFTKLGLIIIDEEHDGSYKQYEPAPRYNARDSAIYLAHQCGAKCLLGSATPSLESFHNAASKKYGYVSLNSRFGDLKLPEIQLVNTEFLAAKSELKSHFSRPLLDSIRVALEKKEQVILFQNRRGYALRLVCNRCQWMPQCKNCDVTLTFHKQIGKLKCHYCGYTTAPPQICPACASPEIKMQGFGTEKIEDELPLFFPDKKIKRMDLETTRSKNSYQEIINEFEDRKIDILVGTQMVTKGLDFDNVGLVGVMNADAMMSFPDFRAFEKSFQQLMQVSGRAGRKNKQGQVVIQTRQPQHPVLQNLISYKQKNMMEILLAERQNFKYPPFYKLIIISLKHRNSDFLNDAASVFFSLLNPLLGTRVIGPEYPVIGRIKGLYIKNIMIKFESNASANSVKKIILEAKNNFYSSKDFQTVKIVFDVDPV